MAMEWADTISLGTRLAAGGNSRVQSPASDAPKGGNQPGKESASMSVKGTATRYAQGSLSFVSNYVGTMLTLLCYPVVCLLFLQPQLDPRGRRKSHAEARDGRGS